MNEAGSVPKKPTRAPLKVQAKGEINNGRLVDWHAEAYRVLMQPMAVTSPQEESQSGTIARHAAAGPDAGRPTAFPDIGGPTGLRGRETPREHAESESSELNGCGVGMNGPWSRIKPN